MSEFVMTRCAQLKKNAQENFISVTFSSKRPKKDENSDAKSLHNDVNKDLNAGKSPNELKMEQEKEMKRLRWDVMKFASSNLQGASKHKAKVALAISLGAEPPKKRRKNYKKLKEIRQRQKEVEAEKQAHESGFAESLKKQTLKKKKKGGKKDSGILGVYGKVRKESVR